VRRTCGYDERLGVEDVWLRPSEGVLRELASPLVGQGTGALAGRAANGSRARSFLACGTCGYVVRLCAGEMWL